MCGAVVSRASDIVRGYTHEYLTGDAWRTATELDLGRGGAEIRGHGEVGDCGGRENDDTDLMEETGSSCPLCTALAIKLLEQHRGTSHAKGPGEHGQVRECH